MIAFQFSPLSIYAGHPVSGFSMLMFDTPEQTRALLHVEWTCARILVSGLWIAGALEIPR